MFNLCGCANNEPNELPKTPPNPTSKPEVPKYNNTDYDGSYYFDITSDNGVYTFYAKGYLVIDNGKCKTENQFDSSQGHAYKREYEGTCKFEDGKLNILLEYGSRKSAYICSIENKNLKCELNNTYGLSGNTEHNTIFEYKYDLNGWNEYKQYFSLYLPKNLRWNISAVELIEKYGTNEIESAPRFSKELSWTHPLYTSAYKRYYIDEHTFLLSNNKLVAYFLKFEEKHSNPYSLYKDIKEVLVKKYGNPTKETFNWSDKTYKSDGNRWNDAMRYNHLDIKTVWNFNGYKLLIIWKYGDTMNIEYVLNGHEGQL